MLPPARIVDMLPTPRPVLAPRQDRSTPAGPVDLRFPGRGSFTLLFSTRILSHSSLQLVK